MNTFISVVSHGHDGLILQLDCLSELVKDFCVVVKCNTPGESFESLLKEKNFHLIDDSHYSGFSENNNIIFQYCRKNLLMTDADYFIVLNPDVKIVPASVKKLLGSMRESGRVIAAINLYKDLEAGVYDNSIRHFPSFYSFISSFVGLGNSTLIDKRAVLVPQAVDWAAGSFIAFNSGHFRRLSGFDENYFMYCEDIDICYRSYLLGEPVMYYPGITGLHLAMHDNRRIFSRNFFWHLSGAIRFSLKKAGLIEPKTTNEIK